MSEDLKPPPIVFISYSHDSEEHKTWVRDFATELRYIGIDVILDQWEIGPGDDVPKFMEQSVRRALRVIMVCTEQYVRKADDGKGGAGYEAMVVTGELVQDLGSRKFIPVIRQAGENPTRPICVSTRYFVDFSHDENFAEKVEVLARAIHDAPRLEKPTLGTNPFTAPATTPETGINASAQTEDASEPYQIYELALSYANAGDFAKWRDLIHREKDKAATAMLQWKTDNQDRFPNLKKDLPAYFLPAVATHCGLFAAVFAALDSTDDRFHNQLSLLDWIRKPKGWERSGPLLWVALPDLVLFTYQALLGALALNRQRPQLAYSLAVTPIAEQHSGRDAQPLFKQSCFTGWPESLEHTCTLGWIFLKMAAKEWQWLWKLFGSKEDIIASLVAYYLFINTVDFVSAARAKKDDAPKLRDIKPPLFLEEADDDVRTRAQSLFFGTSNYIGEMFEENGISRESLPDIWTLWLQNCEDWVGNVYHQRKSRNFIAIPHHDLPTMLFRGPTKRLID